MEDNQFLMLKLANLCVQTQKAMNGLIPAPHTVVMTIGGAVRAVAFVSIVAQMEMGDYETPNNHPNC